jgi:Domain of unknown function (DUF4440)
MLLAFLALAAIQSSAVASDAGDTQKYLRTADQALLDAIAPGDKQVWDRLLAKDATYVDENGAILHRDKFLAALRPLPAGSTGRIDIVRYEATIRGNVALVIHQDDERENYHGIPLHAEYLMTETWVKEGAEWRLALVHAHVVAKDPPEITSSAKVLDEYRGSYRAAADLSYVIRREGDHLIGERQGLPPVTLAQEATDVFFVAGQPRDRKIFRRDSEGHILDFVDRREGEDLVFIRGK